MKLPDVLGGFLQKKQTKQETFASVLLDADYVSAALWQIDEKGQPHILSTGTEKVENDTWESRLDSVDGALATIEDAAGTTQYSKAVLGLPNPYLTESGEIRKEIRPEIKIITKELELTPIGFVSLHQALMYTLKKDEGVPPSVILLGVSHKFLSLSMYKVGALAGQKIFPRSADAAVDLENILQEFKHLEVLPARILLYGVDGKNLEDLKNELLRYPWTTRVNFLHFPKIELMKPEEVIRAVSLAGASELASEMGQEEEITVSAPPIQEPASESSQAKEPSKTEEETLTAEAEAESEDIEEGEDISAEEESNVVTVDAAALGFRKNVDVLETGETARGPQEPKKQRFGMPAKLPAVALPRVDVASLFAKIKTGGIVPIAVVFGIIVIALGAIFWVLPKATVTILELPQAIEDSEQITIDPTATVVDAQNKIIPGVSQQQTVSGEKTIPVTGKKKVGDPAKGSVTISNRTFSSQSFKKGTKLTVGKYEFTLDQDVTVASATGTFGGSTYGQADVPITAAQIGSDSNLPADSEFLIKDVSSEDALARNAKALTGGTSRDVTVVSRADYDAFIEAVSQDLIDQAKTQLSASVSGGQKLIDETIKTSVAEKIFAQELDQEATELSGKATITVTGTAYNEDDVKTILTAFIANQIPSGYTLAQGKTTVSIADVVVKKDGKITAKAKIQTTAVPTLDLASIQKNLAGKKISEAETYLRAMPGVAGVEFIFRMSLGKNRLPMNAKNISVGIAIP